MVCWCCCFVVVCVYARQRLLDQAQKIDIIRGNEEIDILVSVYTV